MELPVNLSEPFLINVRVNLRSRYIHMAKHLLNTSQICPPSEQMRGETMPQSMRRQIARHTRPSGIFLN